MHSANSSQCLASLALRQLLLSHRGAGHQGRAHCPAGLSWANGSILWTSRMEGKKEGEEERALSTALGLYFCAAPISVCVCVCMQDTVCTGTLCTPTHQTVYVQG